jgi:hypothetical protein
MSERPCHHPDIRKFDGVRCCLACGEAVFETVDPNTIGGSSSASPSPYEYIPLDYKLGQEIRLLVLKPGEPSDRLRCDVVHVNLEDEPDYEAVSYTWASDNEDAALSRSIYCKGNKYITLTVNCDKALRQLRKRGLERRLWIDAVCINQTSIDERNHQVGLMDRIYSHARSVRICISDELFNYREFFCWLRSTSTQNISTFKAWQSRTTNRLLSLRYFQRAWVIQEVVLAREVYLLLNDDELLLSSRVLNRLSFIAKSKYQQFPGVLRIRHKTDSTPSINIVACLRAGVTCHCTDARDKVFAVLSLMETQSRSLIPVDYSLDVASVHASAVIAIVASHRNLDILSYVSSASQLQRAKWLVWPAFTLKRFELFLNERDQGRTTFLQSQFNGDAIGPWRANIEVCTADEMGDLPHITIPPGHTTIVFRRKPDYTIGASLNIMPRFQIRAHFIDKVVRSGSYEGAVTYISIYGQEENRACRIGETIRRSPRSCHSILPFFRKWVIASLEFSMHDSDWSAHTPYQEDKDEVRRDEVPGCNLKDLIAFATIAIERGTHKTMFLTRNSIGFASDNYQPDDEIWAIDGARVPFILRKSGLGTYRIVSECYLWAALELDYWNPGTRKGRWSGDRPTHNEQQTHIIEIH